MDREATLDKIKSSTYWDLIIIGGGAMGLGCAFNAAGRGAKVLLLEGGDFASGTSSRSSKMIHGGLRYLKQLDFNMVCQSLIERNLLLQTASSLVKEQRIIIPFYKSYESLIYRFGLLLYDMLAFSPFMKGIQNRTAIKVESSSYLNKQQVSKMLPGLKKNGIKGGVAYSDAMFDDARMAISLARAATGLGADLINYMPVIGLLKQSNNSKARIKGVIVRDKETAKEYEIMSRTVINATGVFSNKIMNMDEPENGKKQVISQGSHIVLPRSFLPSQNGMLIPHTVDNRVIFCLPWYNRLLVGTTDLEVDNPEEKPRPSNEEIDFILEHCSSYFERAPMKGDLLASFAGQRALVLSKNKKAYAKELSRNHKIELSKSGLISVLGGKWTTYRLTSEKAVNFAMNSILSNKKVTKCKRINLNQWNCLEEQLSQIKQDIPDSALLIHPNLPYTKGHVIAAVRHEMARTAEDVLARRTRSLFMDVKAANSCAQQVIQIMAQELYKNDSWIRQQKKEFHHAAHQYLIH